MLIVDKERDLGAHASGRNSGVLHAGIYYPRDSLKARFCVEGNRRMRAFCREHGLALRETGKVVVTTGRDQLARLRELKRRADRCGARARLVDAVELREIEPHATTCERALHSPDTAVVRPREILEALRKELAATSRVSFQWATEFLGLADACTARTTAGRVRFGAFVNAAGAHADRVARAFGLAGEYRMLPFKGTYLKLRRERTFLVRGNIYPVPDLRNPFLGVHFTRSAEDTVYVGPTALPALGRESYGWRAGLNGEAWAIASRQAVLFLGNPAFRAVALTEPRKYSKAYLAREASRLVPGVEALDLLPARKVGIRAQLVHWPSKQLVMDFLVLESNNAVHVLNAISPGFTTAMPFAEHVVDRLLGGIRKSDALSVREA